MKDLLRFWLRWEQPEIEEKWQARFRAEAAKEKKEAGRLAQAAIYSADWQAAEIVLKERQK